VGKKEVEDDSSNHEGKSIPTFFFLSESPHNKTMV